MAKQRQGVSTLLLLLFFLLLVCTFVTGSLYLELRHKNKLLEDKIAQLEQSQVLLMVPDEQAQALADWMATNPEFTQSLIRQAQPGAEVSVQIGPLNPQPSESQQNKTPFYLQNDTQQKVAESTVPVQEGGEASQQAVKLSEDKDGVKVISLPHGGIRVTTREDN